MNRTSFPRGIVPAVAALTLGLGLAACGAGNEDTDTPSGDDSASSLSGTVSGGGASSQEKAQAAWRAGFQTANPEVTVNYDPIGSGDGRANFISGAFAFAGSDSYPSDDEGELTAATENCGAAPIVVPAYVSPIAVAFNLPGIAELNMTASTIAQIFDGKITAWNDPVIAADNEGVELPDTTISPVHRSDDSGTTDNFTDYLSQAGEGAWSYEADGVWPISSGEAAEGTSGVVGAITNGEGTIGYADDSAIKETDLGVVSVKVGEEFTAPSPEGAATVVAVSPPVEGRDEVDMSIEVDRTTTEAGAYPIVLVSYLLACQTYEDAAQAALVEGFLSYVISTEGQEAAAAEAGSAPLEAAVQERAAGIVGAIAAK